VFWDVTARNVWNTGWAVVDHDLIGKMFLKEQLSMFVYSKKEHIVIFVNLHTSHFGASDDFHASCALKFVQLFEARNT